MHQKEGKIMLKIRLKRLGAKKAPAYRIIVINSTTKREGRPIQELGHYNPKTKLMKLDKKSALEWVKKGAQPTETVKYLIDNCNTDGSLNYKPKKEKKLSKKAIAKLEAEKEAKSKAKEEAKTAKEAPVEEVIEEKTAPVKEAKAETAEVEAEPATEAPVEEAKAEEAPAKEAKAKAAETVAEEKAE
ncbi:MAG: 30S ribosomal protein S16 [Candidatus Gastranaerophilales bacterium]|nr:30S ribosomal protein S16 [Candidatus Gastranaerophilales bacterium]